MGNPQKAIEDFFCLCSSDTSLRKQLKELNDEQIISLANSKGFDFSFEDLQDTLDPGDSDKPLETKDLQLVAGGARALNAVSDGLVSTQFAPSSRLKAAVERSLVAVSSLKGSSPIKHETERSTQAPKQGKKDFDNNNQLSHYIALQAESLAERLMHAQDFKSPLENMSHMPGSIH